MKVNEIRAYILAFLDLAEKKGISVFPSVLLSKVMAKADIKETTARTHLLECEQMGLIIITSVSVQLTHTGKEELKNIEYISRETP